MHRTEGGLIGPCCFPLLSALQKPRCQLPGGLHLRLPALLSGRGSAKNILQQFFQLFALLHLQRLRKLCPVLIRSPFAQDADGQFSLLRFSGSQKSLHVRLPFPVFRADQGKGLFYLLGAVHGSCQNRILFLLPVFIQHPVADIPSHGSTVFQGRVEFLPMLWKSLRQSLDRRVQKLIFVRLCIITGINSFHGVCLILDGKTCFLPDPDQRLHLLFIGLRINCRISPEPWKIRIAEITPAHLKSLQHQGSPPKLIPILFHHFQLLLISVIISGHSSPAIYKRIEF